MVSGSRQHRYKTLDRPVPLAATALTTDLQTAENRRHSESLTACLLACRAVTAHDGGFSKRSAGSSLGSCRLCQRAQPGTGW